MKDKIKIFLDTDLLEKYLLGATSDEESLQVERYIAMYPEVKETYDELQDNLETYAKMHAIKTPEGLKERIIARIRGEKAGRKRFFPICYCSKLYSISVRSSRIIFLQSKSEFARRK